MTTNAPNQHDYRDDTVAAFGNVDGIADAIRQALADELVLDREGRKNAAKGAGHLIATCVRRLCATAAASRESSAGKVDLLVELRSSRYVACAGPDVLLCAMIDAAVALETAAWPHPTSIH